MLGAGEALLQHLMNARQVAIHQRIGIEPQAGKDLALVKPGSATDQTVVAALAQDEPVNGTVVDAPDDIFADAVAAIDAQLVVQVKAGAAGGYLRGQLGAAGD